MEHFIRDFLEHEHPAGMIFDVDGTILDSMPVWQHSGERYLASMGISAPPSLGRTLFSMTLYQGAEYMKKIYQLQLSPEEIMSGVIQGVEEAYCSEVPLKPGILAFLKALRASAIPMAIVTSSDRKLILSAFRRLGVLSYFTEILTSTEFGSGKDRPEIFHAAALGMHTRPDRTWVVEDGLYAIRTAGKAGYRTIGVSDAASRQDKPEIRGLADYFIDFEALETEKRSAE